MEPCNNNPFLTTPAFFYSRFLGGIALNLEVGRTVECIFWSTPFPHLLQPYDYCSLSDAVDDTDTEPTPGSIFSLFYCLTPLANKPSWKLPLFLPLSPLSSLRFREYSQCLSMSVRPSVPLSRRNRLVIYQTNELDIWARVKAGFQQL